MTARDKQEIGAIVEAPHGAYTHADTHAVVSLVVLCMVTELSVRPLLKESIAATTTQGRWSMQQPVLQQRRCAVWLVPCPRGPHESVYRRPHRCTVAGNLF